MANTAVVVNELGDIGLDNLIISQATDNVVLLDAGCLCCANQLPLQVALSQLLARARPDRVLIEPTGLGHPARVLETVRGFEPQQVLAFVLDKTQLRDSQSYNAVALVRERLPHEVGRLLLPGRADRRRPVDDEHDDHRLC